MSLRTTTIATAAAVAVLGSSAALAAEYVVQIGAFRRPSADFAQAAEPFGEVIRIHTRAGITLFHVGTFPTASEAQQTLVRLRSAGYADAFVRRASSGSASLPAVSAGPRDASRSRFERLPPELQARTVYLDGTLHVKEGERFIPLSDYEDGRYR